jgi:zinc transporter ZupT
VNLYETLGLVAIGAGLGVAVGTLPSTHHQPLLIAAAVLLGVVAGVVIFLALRKFVTQLKKPTEQTLAVLYVLTFLGVLLTTWAAAFGTFAIAGILNR